MIKFALCLLLVCSSVFAESRAEKHVRKTKLQAQLIGTWKIAPSKSTISVDDAGNGWLVFLPAGQSTKGKGNDAAPRFAMLIVSQDGKSAKKVDYGVDSSSTESILSMYFYFEDAPDTRVEYVFPSGETNLIHIKPSADKKSIQIQLGAAATKVPQPNAVTAILKKLEDSK